MPKPMQGDSTAAHLRLVTSTSAPSPSKRKPPALRVIEWSPDPEPGHQPWRYDQTGRLLPRVNRWNRLRLSRHQATKHWRSFATELDKASDDLARTNYADDALRAWDRVAMGAVMAPWGQSLTANLHNLRTRIALAAVWAGEQFEYGGLSCSGYSPKTRAAAAFDALDHIIWRLIREEEERARRQHMRGAHDRRA